MSEIAVLVVAALSFGVAVISLALLLNFRAALQQNDPARLTELHERVSALDNALTDLQDRTTHWMRREAVRRVRQAQEDAPAPPENLSADPHKKKLELRRRMNQSQQAIRSIEQ